MIHQLLTRDLLAQADSVTEWNLVDFRNLRKETEKMTAGTEPEELYYYHVEVYQGKDHPIYLARGYNKRKGYGSEWRYHLLAADHIPEFDFQEGRFCSQPKITLDGSKIDFIDHPSMMKAYVKAFLSVRDCAYEIERYPISRSEAFDFMSQVKKWEFKDDSTVRRFTANRELFDRQSGVNIFAGQIGNVGFKARRMQPRTFNLDGEKISEDDPSYNFEAQVDFGGSVHVSGFDGILDRGIREKIEDLYVQFTPQEVRVKPKDREERSTPKEPLTDPWEVDIPEIGEAGR